MLFILNEMKAYTLKQKQNTQELHLFEGEMQENGSCTSASKSLCKKMLSQEQIGENVFTCKSESEARQKCASLGKVVCGTCVSHLYESY